MEKPQPAAPESTEQRRKPYEPPSLRVFGSVAAITAQFSRDMGSKDGGPNNFKT